jgi:hypothetical protein
MTWSSNRTWTANSVLAAADLNTYLRDQLNALGAMYGLKQRVIASSPTSFLNQSSTSYADITNATLSITTTGGRLVIYQEVSAGAEGYEIAAFSSGSSGVTTNVKCFVGATDLGAYGISTLAAGGSLAIAHRQWSTTPVAGTYTVKLQYKTAAVNQYSSSNMKLVAEEWGLVSA